MQHAYRKYRVSTCLTTEQKSEIRRLQHGQRQAYNRAVSRIKDGWPVNNEYGLYKEHTIERRDHEWMRAVPAAVQRAGIKDAFTAAKMSVKHGHGDLKYRTRRRQYSLKCPLAPVVTADRHIVKLPRFGLVRAKIPSQIMEHEPRSYEFVPKGKEYLLYVSCRVPVPVPAWNTMKTVKGIDRGAVEPTVVATLDQTGVVISKDCYDTAAPFKENRAWHQIRQRRLSKMNPKSRRSKRLRNMIQKRMYRVSNRRTYAECIAAKHICQDHNPAAVIFEDLRLDRMTHRSGAHKRGLNREMRFVRHHMIGQRVRNRAELTGVQIITTDPGYTSQECARCSHVDKESRTTRDMFRCTRCNYVQQADINAAIIIGRRGLPSAPDDAHEAGPPEVGTPFVRRELDARLNCFAAVGGVRRQCENQAPAHSPSKRNAEKQRQKRRVTYRS